MTLNSIDVGQQLFFGCSHNPSHNAHGTQCGLAVSVPIKNTNTCSNKNWHTGTPM